MVKLAGPAMSLDASGSLGNTLVFSKWKGRNYARSKVTPANPKSAGQVGVRSMFRWLSQIWASLTTANKATWDDRAATTTISPFNAFMALNQTRIRNFKPPTKEDPAAEAASTGTVGALTATSGVRQITVSQAITTAGNLWGVAFFRSPTGSFTPSFSNLVHVGTISGTNAVLFVDTPLANGTYYYDTKPITVSGAWGADTGEQTATLP